MYAARNDQRYRPSSLKEVEERASFLCSIELPARIIRRVMGNLQLLLLCNHLFIHYITFVSRLCVSHIRVNVYLLSMKAICKPFPMAPKAAYVAHLPASAPTRIEGRPVSLEFRALHKLPVL